MPTSHKPLSSGASMPNWDTTGLDPSNFLNFNTWWNQQNISTNYGPNQHYVAPTPDSYGQYQKYLDQTKSSVAAQKAYWEAHKNDLVQSVPGIHGGQPGQITPLPNYGQPSTPAGPPGSPIGSPTTIDTIQSPASAIAGAVPPPSGTKGITPKTSMPSSTGYVNLYDQLRNEFQNPYDALKQGSGTSGTTTPATPGNVTAQNIANNLSTAPDLTSLTNLVNQLNIGSQRSALDARIPGAAGLEAQSSANIGSELGGQIPGDVLTQLQQQAAERGVSMGSPGSANSNAALLRALGLTSLDLQQTGQQNLSQALARNPQAPIFDPSTMFMSPAQLAQQQYQQALLGLDWYNALQNRGGGGRAPQSGSPTAMPGTDQSNPNWWNNLMGGTPSPSSVTPPPGYYAGGVSGGGAPPGTVTEGGSSYYDPFAGFTGGAYTGFTPPPGTVNTDTSSFFDPFSGFTGGGYTDYGNAPTGTVNTDFGSTYDPFSEYGSYFGG